jgi:hypothetical protein
MIARKQAIVDHWRSKIFNGQKTKLLEGLGSFVDATHVAESRRNYRNSWQKNKLQRIEALNFPFIKIDKE